MLHRSIIAAAAGRWRDFSALRLNGVDQLAYRHNPDYHTASAGSWIGWVRFPALVPGPGNGNYPIITMYDADSNGTQTVHFCLRKNSNYADGNQHFDVVHIPTNGGTHYAWSHPKAIAANTWYQVYFGADGSGARVVVDADFQPRYTWGAHLAWTSSKWYGNVAGTNHDLAFGAVYRNGAPVTYGQCDLNNLIYCNRVLTNAEITEHYNAGMGGDPRRLSYWANVVDVYPFEMALNDAKGGEPLTGVNISGSNYITP